LIKKLLDRVYGVKGINYILDRGREGDKVKRLIKAIVKAKLTKKDIITLAAQQRRQERLEPVNAYKS
jgi:hypothetical protein